jgi:hypothetical protein
MLVLKKRKCMAKNSNVSESNKIRCLILLGKFGWIRVQEIALFIWFNSKEKTRYQYAIKLVKRLEKSGLVYLQSLPEHGGTAVLLKPSGKKYVTDYLNKIGKRIKLPLLAKADASKDYVWNHGEEWKHDLIAQGLCAHLFQDKLGLQIVRFYTDRECKLSILDSTNNVREFNGYRKIPDLLIRTEKAVLAIEVERSPKTGVKNKSPLIKTLIKTNQNDGEAPYKYHGLKPDLVVVAYEKDQIYKGGKLDHYKNIKNSLIEQGESIEETCETILFCMLELTIKNFGVTKYKYKEENLVIVDIAG